MKPVETEQMTALAWAAGRLGHKFENGALLREALTHSSREEKPDYERLEFLGDRVLGLVIAELLAEQLPEADEGELGRCHAGLVRAGILAEVAERLGIEPMVRTGLSERGGKKGEGRVSPSILADVMEALLGAVYLDAGWDKARKLVWDLWRPLVSGVDGRDSKTRLQEWLQARKQPLPVYEVVESWGQDHARQFRVKVTSAAGEAEGIGPSKQQASMAAAEAMMKVLDNDE